jgi:hypothetical protein
MCVLSKVSLFFFSLQGHPVFFPSLERGNLVLPYKKFLSSLEKGSPVFFFLPWKKIAFFFLAIAREKCPRKESGF